MSRAPSSWGQVRGALRPTLPPLWAFPMRGLPCLPPPQALLSSEEFSSFLACKWKGDDSQQQTASRPVQGEGRHAGVAPYSGPGIHTASSFGTVKCLAKVKCSQDVGSRT